MRAFTLLAALVLVSAGWWALGRDVALPAAPPLPDGRVACVSYAPFEGAQSPFEPGLVIAEAQIERQLRALSAISGCVRTYSVGQGLERVPAVAERLGMQVMLGIWIGRDPLGNEAEIALAIETAIAFPRSVRALVVGNEVLLRGEQSPAALAAMIARVRAAVPQPVTYADVWERWIEVPELAAAVDFATVHILPYWEDEPVAVEGAVAHIAAVREAVGEQLPGTPILIGETGWPAAGRQRDGALPSPVNQALFFHRLLALLAETGWDYNLIEAFDQPWKRALEGTVGGHWGFLDGAARPKFVWGGRLSDHPRWLWQAAGGALLALLVLLAGWRAPRRRLPGLLLLAVASGIGAPWWVEQLALTSLRLDDWLRNLLALLLAVLLPLLAAVALARAQPRPPLASLLTAGPGPRGLALALSIGLLATLLLAAPWALALVFDPRYRDFTSAALAPPIVALALLRPAPGRRLAERCFAVGLALAALAIGANEGTANGQALLFSALLALLAWSLLRTPASVPPRDQAASPPSLP